MGKAGLRMKIIWTNIQLIFTAIGGWLGWFLGGFDGFLYALVAFVVMDYITGVMLAILERRLSSEVGAKGIFKKVLIFTLVAVGHIIIVRLLGMAVLFAQRLYSSIYLMKELAF